MLTLNGRILWLEDLEWTEWRSEKVPIGGTTAKPLPVL